MKLAASFGFMVKSRSPDVVAATVGGGGSTDDGFAFYLSPKEGVLRAPF